MIKKHSNSTVGYSATFLVLVVQLAYLFIPFNASADTQIFNSIADSYLQSGAPNANNGSEIIMNGLNNTRDGVVKFDLSSIPSGSTITSATLQLVATAVGSEASIKNYGVHRLLFNWVEGTVTWNLPGSTSGTHFITSATQTIAISTAGTYTWNVTSDVIDFLNGSATNYGWRIIWFSNTSGTNKSVDFGTKENTTASNRPVLNVTYTPPATPPTPTPSSNQSNIGTINVVKVVVNDNGGTRNVSSFPLFVNGESVISGETNLFAAPASVYTISETGDLNYHRSFSGDCDFNGQLNLNPGQNKFCIITNNDIGTGVTTQPVAPLIEVIRVPMPLSLPTGPGPLIYTYTLHNIGTVPVTNITLIDDNCDSVELISGDTNNDSIMDVSEKWMYACSTELLESSTGTVTATGWANGISAIDVSSSTVIVGLPGLPDTGVVPPLIHVTKVPNPLALSAGGGTVVYTYKITNPGEVALDYVYLNDDHCSPVLYISGDINSDLKLDITETWTFTCQINLVETTTNTVSARGEVNGLIARDLAVVTVVVPVGSSYPNTLIQQIKEIEVNLGVGSVGDQVRIIQEFLISENKGPAAVALGAHGTTLNFGLQTQAALLEWQKAVGIAFATGNFGPATRAYIDEHYLYTAPNLPNTGLPSNTNFTNLSAIGLKEGDVVGSSASGDPNIYIVNQWGYKRLFLNPVIFGFYGHLGGFSAVKNLSTPTRDILISSGLFRNCETNLAGQADPKVYGLEITGEDTGTLHWINTTGEQAVANDPNFFKKIFCINNNEFNWYQKGFDYTSVSQVTAY